MGNPVSAKSALDIARTALGEAMTQTPANLAAAPTAADFNALLAALKASKILV